MPFFTIIIPTYNRAHTIHTPIDSILAQTFTDWELIIVDDGSTDNTKEIIEGYQDDRIRYVYQENQERSAARNHGIRLAKGEWICFLDSDDEYLPEHLEVMDKTIATNVGFFVFRTAYILKEITGKIIYCNHYPMGKYDNSPFDSFISFVFSKNVFEQFSFNEKYFIAEDFHFLINVAKRYPFFIIEKHTVLVHYNATNSGGIGENFEKNIINGCLCLDDILIDYKGPVLPYVRRKICLLSFLILVGYIKYNKRMIPMGLIQNSQVFLRFPIEYMKLILRIIYVKFGEVSGFYRAHGRF